MKIVVKRQDLIENPLEWQKAGKLETATGYGNKLHTPYMLDYEGRRRRLYCRCFSNVGVTYIVVRGEEVIVDVEE